MADLNEMLGSFLSSPENAEKLAQAINILKSSGIAPPGAPSPAPEPKTAAENSPPPASSPPPAAASSPPQASQAPPFDPTALFGPQSAQTISIISSISALMSAIGSLNPPPREGIATAQAPPKPAFSLPPQLASTIQNAADAINNSKDDHRVTLLEALRPYLNPTRVGMLDNAIRMVRFSNVSNVFTPPNQGSSQGGKPEP